MVSQGSQGVWVAFDVLQKGWFGRQFLSIMKRTISLVAIFLASAFANADELHVSSAEPVFVVAPAQWELGKDQAPTDTFPFETYHIAAPAGRNAMCLISIYAKDKPESADAEFLKKLLRGDSQPYLSSPGDAAKVEIKELKIKEGLGYYANFTDPDLVGKPVEKGNYKTATPIILSLGSKYLIKVTVLCDDLSGTDYQEAIKIVQSIKIKKD
jgi:hypothetical protein